MSHSCGGCAVFLSVKLNDAKQQAELVKASLEEKGISTFLCCDSDADSNSAFANEALCQSSLLVVFCSTQSLLPSSSVAVQSSLNEHEKKKPCLVVEMCNEPQPALASASASANSCSHFSWQMTKKRKRSQQHDDDEAADNFQPLLPELVDAIVKQLAEVISRLFLEFLSSRLFFAEFSLSCFSQVGAPANLNQTISPSAQLEPSTLPPFSFSSSNPSQWNCNDVAAWLRQVEFPDHSVSPYFKKNKYCFLFLFSRFFNFVSSHSTSLHSLIFFSGYFCIRTKHG